MTPQEIFNKAFLGVIAQGGPGVKSLSDGRLACTYKSPDGVTMCGVGQVLGEGLAQKWEDRDFAGLEDILASFTEDDDPEDLRSVEKGDVLFPDFVIENWDLLYEIQALHDVAQVHAESDEQFITSFASEMQNLAQKHGLTVPEVPA